MLRYDVVVVGGGPAGSTVSALIKRYAPRLTVLLLEKEVFPRHHVGESLLAAGSPILHEMGAYDRIDRHGFVEKLGASYIWGRDRKPWGFEFDKLVAQLVAQGRALPERYTKGWHVRRGEYDDLLLQAAVERGVDVRFRARVHDVRLEDGGRRVAGVEYSDARGTHEVSSTLLLDCSGQDGLLAHRFDLRRYDARMNNYALWGYWKGGKWQKTYVGHPDLARIFVATTPRGWIWYIPVERDVMSVGFVTQRQILTAHVREFEGDPRGLYLGELETCPEIAGLLDRAELTRLTPAQPSDVCAVRDWSYDSARLAGPGWALVGDAAGFVDPILSSGVMLAHELGQKAAYTVNSVFESSDDAEIASYWRFYEDTYRTYLRAYREMAAYWYANNFSMESWWWEARRAIQHSDGGSEVTDPEAFMRVASGYANRAESLSLFGSYPLHEARELVDGLFGRVADKTSLERRYGDRKLQLAPGVELTRGLYFFGGRLRRSRRVLRPPAEGYVDLHPGEDFLIEMLDGSHTVRDLNRIVEGIRKTDATLPIRTGTELVVQLDAIGAVRETPQGVTRAPCGW